MSDAEDVYGPLPLTGGDPLTGEEVAAAYPWPDARVWVRAMMVTTLDGAATGPDGLSGSVSSPADQLVFNAVRRHADAVLIGAGTMRAEQYTPMRAKPADTASRAASGQAPAPVIVVVSASLNLPWDLPVWRESAVRPLVVTSTHADRSQLAIAGEHATVVAMDDITPTAIVDALVDRDLPRIVCEGGPRLLRDLVGAGLVDEADITVSPVFAGTATSPPTPALAQVNSFKLAHVLQGDGALMMRYLAVR
ncbi:dihydrofolate reductase family protein [Flexivirga oryzae]|uniref:Riboflavin biosynthesis pyrimidine reductase n=1 Tax=Flexivirga oryzae TaxID=1794944 RepID=A0A839N7R4_9MICO|nr:riboflavin biosynthesis pyrimidine reductase [Flexivirga oryzae]